MIDADDGIGVGDFWMIDADDGVGVGGFRMIEWLNVWMIDWLDLYGCVLFQCFSFGYVVKDIGFIYNKCLLVTSTSLF